MTPSAQRIIIWLSELSMNAAIIVAARGTDGIDLNRSRAILGTMYKNEYVW